MKNFFIAIAMVLVSTTMVYSQCKSFKGTWKIKSYIKKGTCDMKNRTDTIYAKVKQKGCKVIFDISGLKLKGKVKGSTATISGKYEDDGYITKNLKLSIKGRSLKGSGTWTYDMYSMYKCKGREILKGRRY